MSSALRGPAFDEFKSKFKGDLIFPSDPDYADAIKRWALNAERHAAVVAFVKDAEDVSLAINFVRQTSPRLDLAIKGGGHSPAGNSSSEDGLVIDLSRYIDYARVDPTKKVAHVGGGAVWKTVDDASSKYGLATIAGTVNHTGVGGLTVGGGYGVLTSQHGLAIDNLLQATVVVGDGSILSASEIENPDLFFGIRGGGSNFGVVTEFVLKLHPQPSTIFLAQLIFALPQVEALFETLEAWRNRGPSPKESSYVALGRTPPPERHPIAAAHLIYNGSAEEGKKVFKDFYDLNPMMDLSRTISYVEVNTLQNAFAEPGYYTYMKGLAQSRMTGALAGDMLRTIADLFETAEPFEVSVLFETWSMNKIREIAPEAMAFNNRSNNRNVVVGVRYSPELNTPENLETARKITYRLIDMALSGENEKEKQDCESQAYGNFADDTIIYSTERSAKYFGSNFPKLREIKKKYDPDCLFMKYFPIPHPPA